MRGYWFSGTLYVILKLNRFNQANSLHMHRSYVHGGNNRDFCCPLCGRLYKTVQLLKRHCKISHQDENIQLDTLTKQSDKVAYKRQFYCSDCGETFTLKSELKKHQAEHIHQISTVRSIFIQDLQNLSYSLTFLLFRKMKFRKRTFPTNFS